MASESPYDRLGGPVESARQQKRRPIRGRAAIQVQAHRGTGEWRAWRGVLDATAASPFDLRDRDQTPSRQLLRAFATSDGVGEATEDLTADTGVDLDLFYATPELEGTGVLLVTDTAASEYTLAFKAPGDSAFGDAVTLTDDDWTDPDTGAAVAPRVYLTSADGRYAIDVAIGRDLWLILWLGRCTPLAFRPRAARDELVFPGVTLG